MRVKDRRSLIPSTTPRFNQLNRHISLLTSYQLSIMVSLGELDSPEVFKIVNLTVAALSVSLNHQLSLLSNFVSSVHY